MEFKHELYWSKMEVKVSHWQDGFDTYHFYVRIGPPTEEYMDTPIATIKINVTRPTPNDLIDYMFDAVKEEIKKHLKEYNDQSL